MLQWGLVFLNKLNQRKTIQMFISRSELRGEKKSINIKSWLYKSDLVMMLTNQKTYGSSNVGASF